MVEVGLLLSSFQLYRVCIVLFSFKLIGAPQTICSFVYKVKLNYIIMNIYFALAFISLNPRVILVYFLPLFSIIFEGLPDISLFINILDYIESFRKNLF